MSLLWRREGCSLEALIDLLKRRREYRVWVLDLYSSREVKGKWRCELHLLIGGKRQRCSLLTNLTLIALLKSIEHKKKNTNLIASSRGS